MRILVVDDDQAVRDSLRRSLAFNGYEVEVAGDGLAALESIARQRPDALVLDVMMPRLDGWAVLAALKANSDLADIPVILLTIVDAKQLGYTLGVAEYLTKPINREQLVAVLRKHLNHRPAGPVLVVEDDPPIRRALRRALGREGRSVIEAENGLVALERLNMSTPPEAIILDLMMPEMDGFAFLEQLRKNPVWRTIPVIILTAKDLTAEDRRRLNGHVERILEKGEHSLEDLLPEVRKLVADCVATQHLAATTTTVTNDGGSAAT
jgi:CheY-like chemotaxis protein